MRFIHLITFWLNKRISLKFSSVIERFLKLRWSYPSHWDAMRIRWRYLVKVLLCRLRGVEWVSVIDILWRSTFSYSFRTQDKSYLFSEAFPELPNLQLSALLPLQSHSMSAELPWYSKKDCLVEQEFIFFYSCYNTFRRKHPYLNVHVVPHSDSILLIVSAQQIFD